MICAGNTYCDSHKHSAIARLLNDGDAVFEPKGVELRVEKVLRMQGYKNLSRVHPEILSIAEAMTDLAQHEFKPTVHFRREILQGITEDALIMETGKNLP